MNPVDLRSDTITRPTAKMRKAMFEARVGDDVYGEDPTVNALEEMAAHRVGTEAALFVPSGTMSNQIAVMVHTRPGQEVITEATAHIFLYEAGALGRLGSVQVHILEGERGLFSSRALQGAIRGDNIHFPPTGLVTLENTHNRAGGRVFRKEEFREHLEICSEHNIPVHLDGARIFNAAVALNCSPASLVEGFDSVSFCLSKGLGAPVGSLLCGSKVFIKEARRCRKILGGAMRQAGILAAAGIVALEDMTERLQEDHERAKELAEILQESENFSLGFPVDSNIIVAAYRGNLSTEALVSSLAKDGLLVNPFGPVEIRLVTHMDLEGGDMKRAGEILVKY